LAAESGWLTNGVAISGVSWAKSTNGFGASLHLMRDRALIDSWYTLATPIIQDVEVAPWGTTNYVVVLFAGAPKDAAGRSDIRYDLQLVGPHGDSYKLASDAVGWEGFKIASPEKMQLGMTHVRLVFTNSVGNYVLKAVIRDRLKHLTFELTRDVRVEDESNQQGGANGRQSFGSQTNRTPAAAASRRSP
jgi:hypothetical protein